MVRTFNCLPSIMVTRFSNINLTENSDLTKIHQPEGLTIYVSNDQVLYRDEINKICRNRKTPVWRSVIIIIPLRLGLDTINDVYHENLRNVFTLPQSLGIIGGKPRAAMYFVGYQGREFSRNFVFSLQTRVCTIWTLIRFKCINLLAKMCLNLCKTLFIVLIWVKWLFPVLIPLWHLVFTVRTELTLKTFGEELKG
jgi:hypothetical protein